MTTTYISIEEMKAFFSVTTTDTSADEGMLACAVAASRWVENHTNRLDFGRGDAQETRFYKPTDLGYVIVDDFIYDTDNTIVVKQDDGGGTYPNTLILGTDYYIGPVQRREWEPYSHLEAIQPGYFWSFWNRRTISVTALWGFPEVPEPIVQATLLTARDLWKQRESKYAFGVVGIDEYGPIRPRMNAQVREMIAPYIRFAL